MKTLFSIIGVVMILMAGVIGYQYNEINQTDIVGSVNWGNEYQSTFTGTGGTDAQVLKDTYGTLGSVIITGAGAGELNLYQATTTDATKRATAATTSLTTLVSFPGSAVAGTYTFDLAFQDGLMAVWTGAIGTTTITFR